MAIGQCRSGGITVATVAPAHGADNVVLDNEDSGGPPLPHRGYPMWASKKKNPVRQITRVTLFYKCVVSTFMHAMKNILAKFIRLSQRYFTFSVSPQK